MNNYLLFAKDDKAYDFGFEKTIFLDDIAVVRGETKKGLLKECSRAKSAGKIVVFRALTEEMLRFALEKSQVDIVLGAEIIHPKDSMHYLRSGYDQVLCKIAKEKGKKIGFSFSDILNSKNRSRLIARMRVNLRLCRKYGVSVVFSNFSKSYGEIRSAKDLAAFGRILGERFK
jgi:RNase P/RNase MRP subunit p30